MNRQPCQYIRPRCVGLVSGITLLCTGTASGQLHGGDIVLSIAEGRIVVNAVSGTTITPERIFDDRFGKLGPSLPNRTPDPGFNTLPGAFIGDQPVGVSVRRAARRWTPVANAPGQGEFCTIPTERLEIRKSGLTAQTPAVDPPALLGPAFEIGFTDPFDGFLHEHAVYWLTDPFADGVYALELVAWVGSPPPSMPIATPSEPFWIIFNQNRPVQEVTDAAAWLRARAATLPADEVICPAPIASCPCDWDASGALSVQDIFDFLASYFSGNGDFNTDAATTVQDIFDFLACYFNGCS